MRTLGPFTIQFVSHKGNCEAHVYVREDGVPYVQSWRRLGDDPSTIAPIPARKPCCSGVKVVRWAGILWYGTPFFRRKKGKTYQGCGCPVVTRALWDGIQYAIAKIRVARQS